jgi:ribose 5-phosphate isomerase
MTVGVGGSTVNFFIDLRPSSRRARIKAAVAASEASAKRLRALQIPVSELNDATGW